MRYAPLSCMRAARPLVLAACCAAAWAAAPADDSRFAPDAVRVLVVTGGHDYETSFYTVFEGWPDVAWSHAVSAEDAFKRDLRESFDVLVLYDMTDAPLSDAARKNLRDFIAAGKGVVALHHAILDRGYGEWWYKDVVGGLYLREPQLDMQPSTYKHDEDLDVRAPAPHPITDGLAPFRLRDETYKGMWISPKIRVLLQTDNPTSDGPLAWIGPCKTSRVLYIQPGHDHHAHLHPAYRRLIHQAILWTAGRG